VRIALTAHAGFVGGLLSSFACSSQHNESSFADASDAATVALADAQDRLDAGTLLDGSVAPDSNVSRCALDDKTDPVAFCTQKRALRALHDAAFDRARGVASGWDSTTGSPDANDSGALLHDWHDDLGYAAAIALYLSNASLYGDDELNPTVTADLLALAPLIEQELANLPDEYGGEVYLHLRRAAGGARFVNDTSDGDKLDAIADAYAHNVTARYFVSLSSSSQAIDAAAGDAATSTPDGIIGRARGGERAYLTADVATAAVALLDLAVRAPTGSQQSSAQLAAEAALDHIYRRARDPVTGLYFRALVTSSDPTHDQLDSSPTPSDALATDVTATVALALSRAQEMVNTNRAALTLVAAYPFGDHVAEALSSVNGGTSLYDGPAGDAAATSTGFMEGYIPSAQSLITTKALRDNAFLLAVLHRQRIMAGTRWDTEILPMRATLVQPVPPGGGFFSVVPNQNAYLRAVSRNFNFVSDSDGGEPHAHSYQSAAVVAFVEGMSELLYGRP
jgi:hypothetical protein